MASKLVRTVESTRRVLSPTKIVCVGRNYLNHVSELGNDVPKRPFFFLKPTSSQLMPNGAPIWIPKGVVAHHEVELGLVVGRKLRLRSSEQIKKTHKMGLKGLMLAIDMTARNIQDDAKAKGLPWTLAKGFDTFMPRSPEFRMELDDDLQNFELWLKVNGEEKQRGNTKDMIFDIPRIISDITQVMTLEKNDIILTGTPAGVGPVVPGDVITAGMSRPDGEEIKQATVRFPVEESPFSYEYTQD